MKHKQQKQHTSARDSLVGRREGVRIALDQTSLKIQAELEPNALRRAVEKDMQALQKLATL